MVMFLSHENRADQSKIPLQARAKSEAADPVVFLWSKTNSTILGPEDASIREAFEARCTCWREPVKGSRSTIDIFLVLYCDRVVVIVFYLSRETKKRYESPCLLHVRYHS